MLIILAKVKKKSRTKKAVKKTVDSRGKKTSKKKTTKKKTSKKKTTKKKTSKKKTVKKSLTSRFKIDKNNWIAFYYGAAYIGIFGLFALAIYYSN